jgi:hypothetical protein
VVAVRFEGDDGEPDVRGFQACELVVIEVP